MKNIKKIACAAALLLALTSSSVLGDTSSESSKSTMPDPLAFVWEGPDEGTFIEDPYSGLFNYKDGFLVRRRYVKISEDSIGKMENLVNVATLRSRGLYALENTVVNSMKVSRDDLTIGYTSGLTEAKKQVIMNELEDVVETHFGWEITKEIPKETLFVYTSSETGNRKSVSLGFKKTKYAVKVDIVERLQDAKGKSFFDFSKMQSRTGYIVIPEPVISYNYAMIQEPHSQKDNSKLIDDYMPPKK